MKSCSESAQELLAKVDDIRPTIEAYSAQAESERQLADEVYDELLDGGFFRTLVPKAFGGLELHPVDVCQIWESIARVDSATGWNLQISSAVATFTSWLEPEGLEEIFYVSPDVVFAGALGPPSPFASTVVGAFQDARRLPVAVIVLPGLRYPFWRLMTSRPISIH